MATWPTSLPQEFLLDGLSESADDPTIRSTVDVGPAKLRARYDAKVAVFPGSQILTTAQVAALEDFYDDTLGFGTGEFDWIHPRTLAAASFRFRSAPQYAFLGAGLHRASFTLEVMP